MYGDGVILFDYPRKSNIPYAGKVLFYNLLAILLSTLCVYTWYYTLTLTFLLLVTTCI